MSRKTIDDVELSEVEKLAPAYTCFLEEVARRAKIYQLQSGQFFEEVREGENESLIVFVIFPDYTRTEWVIPPTLWSWKKS